MHAALLIAVVAGCVAFQAFFAAGEIALVAADEIKIRAAHERGVAAARPVARMLERRD